MIYYYFDAELMYEHTFDREIKLGGYRDHHGEEYVLVEVPDTFEGDIEELGEFIYANSDLEPQEAVQLYTSEVFLGTHTDSRTR